LIQRSGGEFKIVKLAALNRSYRTIRTNANAILATVPNFAFQPNHAYTLFVIGEVNPVGSGTPLTVVPVLDL
jgi:hypothetical protein